MSLYFIYKFNLGGIMTLEFIKIVNKMMTIRIITDKFKTLYNIWRLTLLNDKMLLMPIMKDTKLYKKVNIKARMPI